MIKQCYFSGFKKILCASTYLGFLILEACVGVGDQGVKAPYHLVQKIEIPERLWESSDSLVYGGDVRIGDLRNQGGVDFLVYRAANQVKGGATQPCFLAAFTRAGDVLWQKGEGGVQPNRPGPVAIYDIDDDGRTEVICLFAPRAAAADPFHMQGVELQILDGQTGRVEKSSTLLSNPTVMGEGPNWVHQRILIAKLSRQGEGGDFIIKLGKYLYAFNQDLDLLWKYFNPNYAYQRCPAYIPAVGDIDGDGLDEINGGYYLLDDNGAVLWEKALGKNMDSVCIDYWDHDTIPRAFCSGFGFVMDHRGDTILQLGESQVPHGQELRVADFDLRSPGPEMAIRYNGHRPDVKIFGQKGKLLAHFVLNDSPNHTGMEAILGWGKETAALLYNGGALWRGTGERYGTFQELPQPPQGDKRQGWYHAIPADISGDRGEELIIYNPWDKYIFIYSGQQRGEIQEKRFVAGPRQYNPRLMD